MHSVDVNESIEKSRFGGFQWGVVAICGLLLVVDGYDVFIAGTVLPTLINEWSLTKPEAGILQAWALFGMLFGALIFGSLADKFGRRTGVLISFVLFTVATFLTGYAQDPTQFKIARFLAGMGCGGLMPNAVALVSEYSPKRLRGTMVALMFSGYSVGEPWNQAAVFKGVGVPVITDADIFADNPEKVFGLTEAFVEANPNTTLALTKALIRAGTWLDADDGANRAEAVEILSRSEYVGADAAVIANSMTGTFEFEKGDKRPAADFNIFFAGNASYPFYSDAVWTLTQMRRWGQIPEAKSDAWYAETAAAVYKPAIYKEAAEALIADGHATAADFDLATDGYKPASAEFIDAIPFDPRQPNAYIDSLPIGLKGSQRVVGGEITN